jgi:hypothetical protein
VSEQANVGACLMPHSHEILLALSGELQGELRRQSPTVQESAIKAGVDPDIKRKDACSHLLQHAMSWISDKGSESALWKALAVAVETGALGQGATLWHMDAKGYRSDLASHIRLEIKQSILILLFVPLR